MVVLSSCGIRKETDLELQGLTESRGKDCNCKYTHKLQSYRQLQFFFLMFVQLFETLMEPHYPALGSETVWNGQCLAAQSSSRSLVVRPLVGPSVHPSVHR